MNVMGGVRWFGNGRAVQIQEPACLLKATFGGADDVLLKNKDEKLLPIERAQIIPKMAIVHSHAQDPMSLG